MTNSYCKYCGGEFKDGLIRCGPSSFCEPCFFIEMAERNKKNWIEELKKWKEQPRGNIYCVKRIKLEEQNND